MQQKGHSILVVAKDKDVALHLLDGYGLPFKMVGKYSKSNVKKIFDMFSISYRVFGHARNFKPDIFTGFGGLNAAHAAMLSRKPCISFSDSEVVDFTHRLLIPFVTAICTPASFTKKNLSRKQIFFNGFKELAYLHPNYFQPDPRVLSELTLGKDGKFVLLRFVAWQASHDVGQSGLDFHAKQTLIKSLEAYARVFITSESPLPTEFEKYRITIQPEKIHDLLYYATLFVGDSQTMTTEAAVLGTPAIRCNSFVGPHDMGNFIELENKYDLIYSFRDSNLAINKAVELIKKPDLKERWVKKRQRLLSDKIDVTQFMIDLIENYPVSLDKYRRQHMNAL
jgi:hypothetical protein